MCRLHKWKQNILGHFINIQYIIDEINECKYKSPKAMNIYNLPKYGYEGATKDDWDTYDIGWFITLDLIGLTTIGEIGGVSKLLPPCIVCGIKRECFTFKDATNRNFNTTRKKIKN